MLPSTEPCQRRLIGQLSAKGVGSPGITHVLYEGGRKVLNEAFTKLAHCSGDYFFLLFVLVDPPQMDGFPPRQFAMLEAGRDLSAGGIKGGRGLGQVPGRRDAKVSPDDQDQGKRF